MKKTKIVCTIGPVTESVETLKELLNRGMNVMRLNFSHGDYEEHGIRIKNFRQAMSETGIRGGLLLDTTVTSFFIFPPLQPSTANWNLHFPFLYFHSYCSLHL